MREVEVEGAGEGEEMELEEPEDVKSRVRIQPRRTKREQVKLSREKRFELPDDFRHFMLADDDTYQVYVANSISRIETVFG